MKKIHINTDFQWCAGPKATFQLYEGMWLVYGVCIQINYRTSSEHELYHTLYRKKKEKLTSLKMSKQLAAQFGFF